MIAAFYNQDFKTFAAMYAKLENRKIEDEELFGQLQNIMNKVSDYYPSDSLQNLQSKYGNDVDSIPEKEIINYIEKHPDELYIKEAFASVLFDKKQYQQSDSLLNNIIKNNKDYFPALALKAVLKRDITQFDSSYYYIDKLLGINHQSAYAYSLKARTLLKQHKDEEALSIALKVFENDKKDYYNAATLVMAYHLMNKTKERDTLLNEVSKDSSSTSYMSFAKDVISGKEKFRN